MEPLTHYVIVRRDLPFGVLCAQLTHAAGESFYLLHQHPLVAQCSEHVPLGDEVGGSNPSERTILCRDSSVKEQPTFSRQVVGSSPTPGSISRTIAVVLGARNESKLQRLERQLLAANIPHVAIREPDAPWDSQLMAIGIVPTLRHLVRPYLSDYQTIRELQNFLPFPA
jgi:hypothetical protein